MPLELISDTELEGDKTVDKRAVIHGLINYTVYGVIERDK